MGTVARTGRRLGRGLAVTGAIGALVLLAALTGDRADAQAPKRGGRAVVVSPQEPRTLLPHLDLLTLSREVQRLVFDGLLTLDDKGNYVPRLAVEVPTVDNGGVSADARVYTFKLRRGVN